MGNSKNTNNASGNVVSELKVFDNEQFGSTRVVMINDEPWFIGKDIASALGYENGSRDTKRHVDVEDRRVEMLPQYQNGTLVSKRMWLYYLLKECGIVPIHEKYPGLTPEPPSRDELSLALAKHHTKGKSEAEILLRQYRQILQDIKAMEQLEIDSIDEMEKVQQEMEEGRKRLSLMEWLVEGLKSSKDGDCAYWVIYCSFMDGSQPSGLDDILGRIEESCACVDRSTYYRVRSKALDELDKIMSISFLGKNQSLLNFESCTALELLEAYRMACQMAVAPAFLGLKNELFTEQKRLAEELVVSLLEQKQQGEHWVLRCTFMSNPESATEEGIISLIAEVHKKYDRSSYYRIRTKAIKRVEVLLDERRKVI